MSAEFQKKHPVLGQTIWLGMPIIAGVLVDGASESFKFVARGTTQAARYELQFPQRNRMMTDPASAIKREVHQLVDLQIETLRQPPNLTTSDLVDYRVRSKTITVLYHELDQLRRASFKGQLSRAS
ncbi:MAG: hypothetical protein WCA20_30630 [Candidatus Sulfotelmatobacter sp.]